MRILYLSDILSGHDERLIGQLRAAGHEPTLLTFFQRAPELPRFTEGLPIIHERYKSYPDGSGSSRWRQVTSKEYQRDEARACLKIKEVLRSRRFDLTCANWVLTSGYVAAHAGVHPLALFPWGSDLLVWPRLHRAFGDRAGMALRSADLVVCNSKTAADEAKRLGRLRPDRVEVLPIELDGSRFEARPRNDALRASWGFEGKTVVISTRPLKEMYDHAMLLGVLARPGFEGVALALVGDGNLRADLEKRTQELKIGDRVKFIGAVENEKMPEYLSAADLYATCSRGDSAALGLLEAMAMGVPAVASDIPANREWIADGQSGWLFPVGNADGMALALQKAVSDENNRQEVALRARAISLARGDGRRNFPRLLARLEGLAGAPRPQ